jgi:hypothetical protein
VANKNVYITMPEGMTHRDDIGFFASVEALWSDYRSRDTFRKLSHEEFVEAIENTELVEEGRNVWYRDTMVEG